VVPEEEDDPNPIVIRTPNPDGEFAIKKLIEKRIQGNRTQYLVWWKGYKKDEATWETKGKIPKKFVEDFEKGKK
jgi:hypothetical protein